MRLPLLVYHKLPSPLRSLAASAWGLRLRRWRYGPNTERFVEEALERDEMLRVIREFREDRARTRTESA